MSGIPISQYLIYFSITRDFPRYVIIFCLSTNYDGRILYIDACYSVHVHTYLAVLHTHTHTHTRARVLFTVSSFSDEKQVQR